MSIYLRVLYAQHKKQNRAVRYLTSGIQPDQEATLKSSHDSGTTHGPALLPFILMRAQLIRK